MFKFTLTKKGVDIMKKQIKFTIFFILIFLIGILLFVTNINHSLEETNSLDAIEPEPEATYIPTL